MAKKTKNNSMTGKRTKVLVGVKSVTDVRVSKDGNSYRLVEFYPFAKCIDDKWINVSKEERVMYSLFRLDNFPYTYRYSSILLNNNILLVDLEDRIKDVTTYTDKDGVVCKHRSSGLQILEMFQASSFDVNDIVVELGANCTFKHNIGMMFRGIEKATSLRSVPNIDFSI